MSEPADIEASNLPPVPASMRTPEMLAYLAAGDRLAATASCPVYFKTARANLKKVEG